MTLDEDLLGRAIKQARDQMLSELPDEDEMDYIFSDTFAQKIELLQAGGKPLWQKQLVRWSRRAAAFVLVGFIGFSACIISVDAWRERLFEMVEQKHPEYSNITYEPVAGRSAVDFQQFELVEYRPAYLPQGYRLTDQLLNTHINWSTYTNAGGAGISFHQSILGTSNSAINTEDAELIPFDLNGDAAYQMSNRGMQFVLWSDERYEFMILTQEPMEEAIAIAKSVTVSPEDAYHPPQLEKPLSERPLDYTVEDAVQNGDVTVHDGGTIENLDVLDAFLTDVEKGNPSIICIADFDGEVLFTKELYYDGFRINCDVDETRLKPDEGSSTVGHSYKKIFRAPEDAYMVVYVTDNEGIDQPLLRYKIA